MMHVQDAYSMTYYYRAFPLKDQDVLESDVYTDGKLWKLKVEVLGKDGVKTGAGSFNCLKIRPTVTLNGVPDK